MHVVILYQALQALRGVESRVRFMSVPSWRRCVDVLQRPLASGALLVAALEDAAGLLQQGQECPSHLLASLRSSLETIFKLESETIIIEKACDVKKRLAGKKSARAASSVQGGGR